MGKFRIKLSESDVNIYNNSSILVDTSFHVQVDGYCFPDNLWTDFAYPILCMWADTLLRNRGRLKTEFDLPFMDGPFWIAVKQNGDVLFMEGINGRNDSHVEFSCCCTASELLHELLSVFNKLEKIVLTNEEFQKRDVKEPILNTIDHYKERIKKHSYRWINKRQIK